MCATTLLTRLVNLPGTAAVDPGGVAGRAWWAVDDRLERWRAGFEDMVALAAGRFAQAESRRRARISVLGLLSAAERKNSWTIAEQARDQDTGRVVADRLRESRCYSVAPLQ